jgi:hypothetical protein
MGTVNIFMAENHKQRKAKVNEPYEKMVMSQVCNSLLAGNERSTSFMHAGLVDLSSVKDAFHLSLEASDAKSCWGLRS